MDACLQDLQGGVRLNVIYFSKLRQKRIFQKTLEFFSAFTIECIRSRLEPIREKKRCYLNGIDRWVLGSLVTSHGPTTVAMETCHSLPRQLHHNLRVNNANVWLESFSNFCGYFAKLHQMYERDPEII